MFSITAINDGDSKTKWQQSLAPTKEAQEFRLSQSYHEGLLKLHAKDYGKAQELLEAVLKDPIVSNAQLYNTASDGHLLQLRFLVLKNLATVFLQQGPSHNENALQCYLQAVEIDTKDSVVWNQLGTLACSMGLLSVSRWAFEQGLLCSPNNWNCMEKLLEVLIAIGDEMSCLSVAELILRHWPSHSRALHVKNTIEESKPMPFAPRGVDKLEPKHVRLKFPEKRKVRDTDLDEYVESKKLKHNYEIDIEEASWVALARKLIEILCSSTNSGSDVVSRKYVSGNITLNLQLQNLSEDSIGSVEKIKSNVTSSAEHVQGGDKTSERTCILKEKGVTATEDQPQERRSSRLESLRNRKPGREDSSFSNSKDPSKVVMRFLESFVITKTEDEACKDDTRCTSPHAGNVKKQGSESNEVVSFIKYYCENRGAYHLGHFLLEEVANKGISYQAGTEKLLELEKLTRHWGQERTPECSLFLAELCYDFAVHYSGTAAMPSFTSDATYHLCKIVESVALEYSLQSMGFALNGKDSGRDTSLEGSDVPSERDSPLSSNYPFWVRYYWLSGQLSLLNGDKVKAREEFYASLSLMTKLENVKSSSAVFLPHCKTTKKLSVDRVLHEINILEVDNLLKKTVPEMIEKGMYSDCIDILAPLLFAANDIYLERFYMVNKEGNEFSSVELSALDVLTRACEHMEQMDTEVYLSCHRRKLQIVMALFSKVFNASDTDTEIEDNRRHWYQLMAVEVKAISQCASRIMGIIRTCGDPILITIPMAVVGEIQSLLVRLMCNLVKENFPKMSCDLQMTDQSEQSQKCYFIDATIALFKLQQLNTSTSIQSQMELIVTIHNMLAEFGICCARGDGEEEEGTFLKLGIKHLLALDMKLKSVSHSSDKDLGTKQHDLQSLPDNHLAESKAERDSDRFNGEVAQTVGDKVKASEDDDPERLSANDISIVTSPSAERIGQDCNKDDTDEYDNATQNEKEHIEVPQCEHELTEDEREELELGIDTALDQCFYCLYGLNLHSDSSYEDDLAIHKNTSRGDYQTKEQCADVFQYILPYAKASSKTGLVKLRRVLRAIRKHFPHPPDELLSRNAIDKFLDDPELCEDKLSEEAGSVGFLDSIMKVIFSDPESVRQQKCPTVDGSDPYLDVYRNLYYLLALSEEIKSTDKWAGFVLTKEGEEFIAQNANLFKYDLLYNPLRLESWKRLANLYDEEVDLMLNDGSKQINVLAWRKEGMLPKRVEASRRRSRRCLLMALALANTAVEQGEIHELLALVYYDGAQNVVPFYDQRSTVPLRDDAWMMFCQNSFKHFEKAFAYKEEWSCAFYMGKLCEKLGYSYEKPFSYYSKAISLNPSAVDPFYRMHASRLKLLCRCGKQNEEAIKVVAAYSHSQSTRECLMQLLGPVSEALLIGGHVEDNNTNSECNENLDSATMGEIWSTLYKDCLLALETCVEGELKHFHKARYVLAQGLYKRGGTGDLEKAKEQLSFCFKSSRSSFTINMWEIDSTVKKTRRCGSKKVLEVNLPESSRKFITCIRKYLLLYLNLLEEMGDICTLDRAYISLRTDKRFSLCLEDLVPVTLGRYVRALMTSIRQKEAGSDAVDSTVEQLLEKMFSLFLEQFNMWSDISSIPEIKSQELTESSLYGHLHKHMQLLEQNLKVEALEVTNEKLRKRLKNPKLSSSNCSTVYKHVSLAWCRSLVISMALITPLHSRISSDLQVQDLLNSGLENSQCLCVDLQSDELWCSSSFEDPTHLKNLEAKWNFALSKLKNVVIKRVSDEDIETATMLLRSSYNFYKDTSCALLPSGINLYMVPSQLATETYIQPGIDEVDILDMNTSRKLLLWAYTLLHGHCSHVSVAIKYCEENAKSKTKKASGVSSVTPNTTPSNTLGPNSGAKDGSNETSVMEASQQTVAPVASVSEAEGLFTLKSPIPAEAKDLQSLSNPSPEIKGRSGSLGRRDPRNETDVSLPNVTASHKKHKMSSSLDSLPQHRSNSYNEKKNSKTGPREEIDLNK